MTADLTAPNAEPRRRNAAGTRAAILASAREAFARAGYDGAGVREIAANAGVTAMLVNRYFGSKEKLFSEVIERAFDVQHLLQGQRGNLADHLARVMVYGQEGAPERVRTPMLLMLHSATEPHAVKLFRRDLNCTELRLLAEQIGGDDATVRAAMIVAQLTGFAIMHHVLRPDAFVDAPGEKLVALLSKSLAACIGSDIAGAASIPDADDA
jgi:AcrR family transcriptional regulator